MKKPALITAILALTLASYAADKQYIYTKIAQQEGLTSMVNCIYKEKDGDVWIGTPNGLYSYNGYTLKQFGNDLYDSRKISHVSRDSFGNLWVLTDKHIIRQKAGSEEIEKISESISPFYSMAYGDGCIWFGSMKNIYRYSYSKNSLELFCTLPTEFDCRSMGLIDDSHLLCCSHHGKAMLNIDTREVINNPFGPARAISATLVDSNGRVWLAYHNNGIEVFEKDGTRIKSYNTGNSQLSNNIILCLAQRGTQILAGTDGGGINIIDTKTDSIQILTHVSGDPSSFPAHSIKSLFIDHYDNIWAGSVRDGLISVSQSEINSYKDTHIGLHNGLSNPTVLFLHQDKSSQYIWIGTDGEGINRFDPKTARFTHYESTLKTKVVSIADYSEEELAISLYCDQILLFNKNTGAVRPMGITDKSFLYLVKYSGRSVNIHNESDGDLIFYSNSLYRYDKNSGSCTPISLPEGEKSFSNFFVMGRTDEGIWLHNHDSIYLLEEDAEELIYKGTHTNGSIKSGHLTPGGTIWLATDEGLCRYTISDGTFDHITTTIFSNATSVICDNRSRVWIGTENGLSAYLSESGSFALFGKSDGVAANEYLQKPRLLASNGDVYFGGVQGLLRIGSEYSMETAEKPHLTLSGLSIDGKGAESPMMDPFTIPRHSKTLDINIDVKEKDMFRHRVFRFEVSDQIYETSVPWLSLQQMPKPGKYDIKVSCTKRNGEWLEPVRLTTLMVPEPWYASWWFIGCCILISAIIYLLTIYIINKRRADELRIAVKEQEQKVYEEKVMMLINISHELRTPLTLIMAPLKRLLKLMESDDANYQVLSRIYRQSRRMRSLLDMVLDLRKLEVGGNRLSPEKRDYNTWISEAVDDIVKDEKAEGIDIVYRFDNTVGLVEFDRQKCDTVLMNILINAIKHSTAGDTITITTESADNGMIRTSISDQGPGLGLDIEPDKMFTRFYQSNNEKYGSGIGLSYSKILVEMHGGSIGVFNNADKGATFWWEIPSAAISDCESGSRAYLNELLGHSSEADITSPAEEAFDTSGMRLMLVDDNQDLLDFLREALCEDFAEILTATGGHAAMQEVASGRLPDIIVSDVNMPEGDGFWLCSELKSNDKYSHIPFVLLTARGEDQSQSESYRLGADGFLAKPFEIDTLLELVRSLLKNKAEIRKRYLDTEETSEAGYGSNEEKFIIQLNKIISDNISNPYLDQQMICRELGVSRALLYNKMKAITGAGAKEYITRIRIEKAKNLIETTSLTIAEISDMTGFASQSYFSTAFKNYAGMTPSAYKASKRNSSENM